MLNRFLFLSGIIAVSTIKQIVGLCDTRWSELREDIFGGVFVSPANHRENRDFLHHWKHSDQD